MKLKHITALTVFLFTQISFVFAQQVHTYVDADSLRVGDIFIYTIVFDGTYQSINFPAVDDFEDELEVLSRDRYQVSANRDSLVYRIQFFGTENITISGKDIELQTAEGNTVLQTTQVPLFFKTTLAEGDEEFRPFKPLFDFARNWWLLIIAIILLAIAAYFAYRWYKKRDIQEKPQPEPRIIPDPFINPLKELKEAIAEISEIHKLKTDDDFEEFYIKLGDSIRYYLKRIYKITALEMTTREIIDSLHQELAPSEIITITRKVLNEADMVKFANFHPDTIQAKAALEKAHAFIETAEIVNHDQIKYMKFKYDEMHGIRREKQIMKTAEN